MNRKKVLSLRPIEPESVPVVEYTDDLQEQLDNLPSDTCLGDDGNYEEDYNMNNDNSDEEKDSAVEDDHDISNDVSEVEDFCDVEVEEDDDAYSSAYDSDDGDDDVGCDLGSGSALDAGAIALLLQDAISTYFLSTAGGRKKPPDIATIAKRVSMFLIYAAAQYDMQIRAPGDIFDLVIVLLNENNLLIEDHATYLKEIRSFSDITVKAYLVTYGVFFKWFTLRHHRNEEVTTNGFFRTKELISSLCKCYGREHAKMLQRSDRSVERMISNMQWPVNGMADIKNALNKRLQFARSFADEKCILSKELYNEFIQFLIAHMYSYAPQSRVQGINKLTLQEARTLLQNGQCNLHSIYYSA